MALVTGDVIFYLFHPYVARRPQVNRLCRRLAFIGAACWRKRGTMRVNSSIALTLNPALTLALHNWPFAVWLRSAPLVYPSLEALHIIAIAITFGSLWIVEMRLLGVRLLDLDKIDANVLAKATLPWTILGFTFAAIFGSLMFLARASDLIGNSAFLVKMLLLMTAGTNAAILHSRGRLDSTSLATRGQAVLSIALWIAIIFCGRWIAYV
jgi:hypothetical protein